VLFRTSDGTPAALEDACPHRKRPLSMGRIQGDHLECDYHCLTFDCSGKCVKVPGAARRHAGAVVQSYPLQATMAESGVTVSRWMHDVEPAPFDALFLAFTGRCDRKQQYEVRLPSHARIAGNRRFHGKPDAPDRARRATTARIE
jgi:nitrite reductase/ring-hydroxylating ferredoxin subunit